MISQLEIFKNFYILFSMEILFTPGNTDPDKYLCLLGHPVGHSLSPRIYNTASANLGLDYKFDAIDIESKDARSAVDTIRAFGIKGCCLTMPLKQAVVPYLDELSETSKLCKSVNCIVNEGGKLVGHTTDGRGFMDALKSHGINLTGHSISVLGAGGAAKPIIIEAAKSGLRHISVFKRKGAGFDEVVAFAKEVNKISSCQVSVHDFADEEDFMSCLSASNLLCNATNVGMGEGNNESPVPTHLLSRDLITIDIIYNPLETRLLREAKAAGAKTMNGVPMLLYQAAFNYKMWTGHDMPVDAVKKELGELL